jgi:NADPH:quinone reductase-like Zn-dependent oxidoreductase
VLVRVRATSVNPIDWKQASGKARPILGARFPRFVPGYDLAGGG